MDPLLSPETSVRLERLVRLARRVRPDRRVAFKQPGKGIEPGARRDYLPGDDLRRVDWPAYARLERMLVKVTEDLPEGRLDLLIDGSASMRCGDPAPATRAALACAGLAAVAVARELRVGVWIGGASADRITLARPGELVRLLRFLARPRPPGCGPDLASLAGEVNERVRRAGPLVILSDGLDPQVDQAAARLRRRQVRVAWIGTESELGPEARAQLGAGVETELVDAETGARLRRTLGPAGLEAASGVRGARIAELSAQLDARGVGCLSLPPGDPFERLAESLLRATA